MYNVSGIGGSARGMILVYFKFILQTTQTLLDQSGSRKDRMQLMQGCVKRCGLKYNKLQEKRMVFAFLEIVQLIRGPIISLTILFYVCVIYVSTGFEFVKCIKFSH